MYRSILLSLLFFSSTFFLADPSKAQITVNSNGAVGITSNPNNDVSLRVVKSGYSYFSYGVQGIIDGSADYSYGVYGNAKNAITNHGVYGEATNSNAFNFGVYGKAENGFMSNYGIYGTVSGTDNWAGYFNGDVYTTTSYSSSDERLKKDIMSLNNADMLTKITELQPRKYQFLTSEELKQQSLPQLNAKEGEHFGLLAQELEDIFPELVTEVVHVLEEDVDPEQRAGKEPETVTTKAINYQELTVVLLAAVQELQAEVEALKAELAEEK